ncbi:hypothetical protein MBLNU457_6397t1 [Dothideomycetes sp. NU457]
MTRREQSPIELEDTSKPRESATMNEYYAEDEDETLLTAQSNATNDELLNRRVIRKLDLILLPFLSLLFLFNSLDKSNIGSAESGNFTKDTHLPPSALNTSVACFFATFVALQPVGAALGRKYGMKRWVPACMALWGLCTALHAAVKAEWQLILLRTLVGMLEAGFYPTTVAYLSLFYTRFEFAKRLGMFYGQAAVAGALGGLLSWAVFRAFPTNPTGPDTPPPPSPEMIASVFSGQSLKSWQVLFLIEGISTMLLALVGFFWLPHSADTAWFFSSAERQYAEMRIRLDRDLSSTGTPSSGVFHGHTDQDEANDDDNDFDGDDMLDEDVTAQLISSRSRVIRAKARKASVASAMTVTDDRGLTRSNIFSALLDWKVWHLLFCNILSALPATAFSVFLPLVIKGLVHSPGDTELPAAKANILTVPPYIAGACVLWLFTAWSDRCRQRLIPILYGLLILLIGLTATVILPKEQYTLRYISLVVLLSGSFVASPLTVAWLTNNIPDPGKRSIVLGINGWGNLAGVIAAVVFSPRFEDDGYIVPFWITLACVLVSLLGFVAFRIVIVRTNDRREKIMRKWGPEQIEREAQFGDVGMVGPLTLLEKMAGQRFTREADMKLTFRYGL